VQEDLSEDEPDWDLDMPAPSTKKGQGKSNGPTPDQSSIGFQAKVLHGYLVDRLGEERVKQISNVLKSTGDDSKKKVAVEQLIGDQKELLAIVHTLLYFESAGKRQ
jgi:hypothetical protein